MRHTAMWRLVLLSGAVAAYGATGAVAQPMLPVAKPVFERAETPTAAPPALDLRIDPTPLPSAQVPPTGPRLLEAGREERYTGVDRHSADRGFSFGVEVKPRSRVGSLAREAEAEDPGLEDELQKLLERGTLGVRGRYRF